MMFFCRYKSPVGLLTITSDGQNITGIWLEGQKYFAATMDSEAIEKEVPVFDSARRWLDLYFAGKEPDFALPLAPKGSEFRQAVWEILCRIPFGSVITYGDIAKQLVKKSDGKKVSAQAVGGAVGHNPISIVIPCHRVVGSNGSLTGYAGGIDKKVFLLELEKVAMDNLFVPKKGTAL
ncbi:methylated-DNA--[protein]-cysteine S-methyltransferase [Selenomonadales bacterium OttesenSCG-928-I06]|nr:methylated-DNA--[protein]-cysteine S-methyltransferase [Selenomonadales bacterium OttesenSCG-928-I06]